MSVKLDHLIKCYDGSTDFIQWFAKVKNVAVLQKITDLASFVPLFFEGEAFMIYQELSDAEKTNVESIEKAMKSAFCLTSGQAYDKFTERKIRRGEGVDVYLADLKRLLVLAGIGFNEKIVKEQFLKGLPSRIAQEVNTHSNADGKPVTLTQVVSRTKQVVRAIGDNCDDNVAAAVSQSKVRQRITCYSCGEEGHIARMCVRKRMIRCFNCGGTGHKSDVCPSEKKSSLN